MPFILADSCGEWMQPFRQQGPMMIYGWNILFQVYLSLFVSLLKEGNLLHLHKESPDCKMMLQINVADGGICSKIYWFLHGINISLWIPSLGRLHVTEEMECSLPNTGWISVWKMVVGTKMLVSTFLDLYFNCLLPQRIFGSWELLIFFGPVYHRNCSHESSHCFIYFNISSSSGPDSSEQ